MPIAPDASALADRLPGTWLISATNLPLWLVGDLASASLEFRSVSADPLLVEVEVASRSADGSSRSMRTTGRLRDGRFVSRGRGRRFFLRAAWRVERLSDDGRIAVLRVEKSFTVPEGLIVLTRDGVEVTQARAAVAVEHEAFGLTPEDFASLSWL